MWSFFNDRDGLSSRTQEAVRIFAGKLLTAFKMVKSKDISVTITKGDISPHLYENKPSTSLDETKVRKSKRTSQGTLRKSSSLSSSMEDREVNHVIPPVPNPFYFRISLTAMDKLKVALMTIFVLPIRVCLVTLFLFLTWLGCFIGLLGYTDEELESKPIEGWRRKWWHPFFATVMRQMFIWGGLRWEFKGQKATREQAPLLVIGPHQSFVDSVIVLLSGGQSPCAKIDSKDIPLLGTVLRFIQPVFVKRSSKESRQTTLSEIKNRATSKEPWSQIVIFPEGTCSNGSVLLKFKQGAFSAGVPVQPVLLRYPNRLNTLTWTWDGPSALKTMWLTTCQWSTKMVIEYLPVYCPSEAERQDPILYAENVRRLMAAALGIGLTDFSYDDLRYLETGDKRQPHHTLAIVKLLKFRAKNGLKHEQLPEDIAKIVSLIDELERSEREAVMTPEELLDFLKITPSETSKELFEALNLIEEPPQNRSVHLRYFLAALHLANMDAESAFKCLSDDGDLFRSEAAFCRLSWLIMQISAEDARKVFHHLQPSVDLQSLRNFVLKQNNRCKGVVYFEAAERLDVETSRSDSGIDGDNNLERQKAE